MMSGLTYDVLMLLIAALLVIANGFFVSAEFALAEVLEVKDRRAVKIRLMLAEPPPQNPQP